MLKYYAWYLPSERYCRVIELDSRETVLLALAPDTGPPGSRQSGVPLSQSMLVSPSHAVREAEGLSEYEGMMSCRVRGLGDGSADGSAVNT